MGGRDAKKPSAALISLLEDTMEPKSKTTAMILCWLLGAFGAHRFYLGYTGLGIAQLLTCGGMGIWVMIDLIMILTGKMTDANGNALQ